MNITEEQRKQIIELFDIDPYTGEFGEGIQNGVSEMCEILGIKIKGIN